MVTFKGMNEYQDLSIRREITKMLIKDEVEKCKMGYNPIKKKHLKENFRNVDLHPQLFFISAFRIAISKIQSTKKHKKEMGWCVDRLEKSVVKLGFQNTTISQLKRRQLKQLFDGCKLH